MDFSNILDQNWTNVLIFVAIGFLAGWLAGRLVQKEGFGVVGNIVIGILGSILGGYLFQLLDFSAGGQFGQFVTAFIGAVVLVFLLQFIKGSKK